MRIANRVLLDTGVLIGSSLWHILISFGLQVLIAYRLGVQRFGQYTAILAYLNVCQVLCELGLPQLLVRDLSQQPIAFGRHSRKMSNPFASRFVGSLKIRYNTDAFPLQQQESNNGWFATPRFAGWQIIQYDVFDFR